MRFIIFEPENMELNINNIEEGFDYRSKLPNPFKTYFQETSDKLKKQAVEQIINNITIKDKRKLQNKTPNANLHNSYNTTISDNFLISKYSSMNMTKSNYDNFIKFFNDSCEHHNIITLDQKIDYFVHLKGSNLLNSMINKKDNLNTTKCIFIS